MGCKLVGKLVGPLVTLSDFQSLVSNGRSNKKSSKNKVHLFSNFVSGRTLLTLENVYEGLNARKCKGRSNQKIQKTKCIYFRILLLGGPSQPTNIARGTTDPGYSI